jgi:hypothetical protein
MSLNLVFLLEQMKSIIPNKMKSILSNKARRFWQAIKNIQLLL